MNRKQIFEKIISYYNKKNYSYVLTLLEQNSEIILLSNNLKIIQAISLRKEGFLKESAYVYESLLLEKMNRNPALYVSYGLLQFELQNPEFAIKLFASALEIDNKFFDAYYNYGFIYHNYKEYFKAIAFYEKALALSPHSVIACLGICQSYIAIGDFEKAAQICKKIITSNPNDHRIRLLHASLLHNENKVDEAEAIIMSLIDDFGETESLCFELAKLKYSMGQVDEGKGILGNMIDRGYKSKNIYSLFFDISWSEKTINPFSLYEATAFESLPAEIFYDYINKLQRLNLYEKAFFELKKYSNNFNEQYIFTVLLAKTERELGFLDKAEKILASIVTERKNNHLVLYEEAILSLCKGNASKASKIAIQGQEIDNHPKWLSLIYTCNKQEGKLNNLLGMNELLEDVSIVDDVMNKKMLHDLEVFLNVEHTNKKAFIDQSARNSSQTEGNLLQRSYELFHRVKKVFEAHIEQYLVSKGKKVNGYISGSWSIQLNRNGQHINHTHSEGDLSACFYISIPKNCHTNGNGWFKCGGSHLSCRLDDADDFYIEPISNRLVIFPSYLWHGTNEFVSEENRLTLAFDYKFCDNTMIKL